MRYLLTILLFSFTLLSVQAQKDWKLEKTKGAIKAYIKDSGKAYKMYKIVCTIKAPLDKVIKKYADVATHSSWMSDIQKSELKPGTYTNELISYYEIKLPWPMENRDAVYKLMIKLLK
jgi:hypothetical protein